MPRAYQFYFLRLCVDFIRLLVLRLLLVVLCSSHWANIIRLFGLSANLIRHVFAAITS